jgi:hypothetical protein
MDMNKLVGGIFCFGGAVFVWYGLSACLRQQIQIRFDEDINEPRNDYDAWEFTGLLAILFGLIFAGVGGTAIHFGIKMFSQGA